MAHGMRTNSHTHHVGQDDWRDSATRYALLPLRIFLGVTFIYAGLDKLTDSAFMQASGAGSIGAQMEGVRDISAIPPLVDLSLKSPVGFGYAIALGELAVGIGTLIGLFARVAALGGAFISLSLWLTVSWQETPYYYGNDLAYLMAWLPLVLAGAAVFSIDARRAARRRGNAPGPGQNPSDAAWAEPGQDRGEGRPVP
ncbi:DoxX family protein [Streptomyces sp. NPDC018029]|uniref:DoxX family protein n=1 Tax=Streptomyces sp. NPDC018029 TaxID=3365032 RepID=UPI00379FCD06